MSSSSTDQTTKKRDLLPLLDIHGHERIHVNQCLPNGDALTKFLKDLCYNQNKALYITKTSSGKSKTYKCPDPDCQWQVRGYRAVDKVVGPHFVVSFVNDVHRDICPSSTTPSGRQLTLLSSFKSAMTSDPKMKMKTLKNQVRLSGGVKGCSDSKVYRAMASARKESEPDLQRSYEKIPALLQEIEEKNPGTYKLVDVDQHGRFLRAFLAIGVCVSSQDSLIPLFGFDGTHSKNANYNGHLLTLVGRDGNNQNVPLALVLAHTENQDNITWFLGACQELASALISDLCCVIEVTSEALQQRSIEKAQVGSICAFAQCISCATFEPSSPSSASYQAIRKNNPTRRTLSVNDLNMPCGDCKPWRPRKN